MSTTENIAHRNFSITEVCVLLALEMSGWDIEMASTAFIEMGGDAELFARAGKRLLQDGVLFAKTRTRVHAGPLFEALELKHRLVATERMAAALSGEG